MIKISGTLTIDKPKAEGAKPCVYFFHQGEEIGHNLQWRRWRPLQLYFGLLPTILRYVGMTVTEEEVREPTTLGTWDQYAACPCGCSPGIALERQGPHDLHVTIDMQTEVVAEAQDTSADT